MSENEITAKAKNVSLFSSLRAFIEILKNQYKVIIETELNNMAW